MQLGIAKLIGTSPTTFKVGPKSMPPIDVAPIKNAIAKLPPTRNIFDKKSMPITVTFPNNDQLVEQRLAHKSNG